MSSIFESHDCKYYSGGFLQGDIIVSFVLLKCHGICFSSQSCIYVLSAYKTSFSPCLNVDKLW